MNLAILSAVLVALEAQAHNMNRKQRRTLQSKMGKDAFKAVSLMLDMPTECSECHKAFDKKNKEMALTWMVKVYSQKNVVDLKCPECWQQIVEKHTKEEEISNSISS